MYSIMHAHVYIYTYSYVCMLCIYSYRYVHTNTLTQRYIHTYIYRPNMNALKEEGVIGTKACRAIVYKVCDVIRMFGHWGVPVPQFLHDINNGKVCMYTCMYTYGCHDNHCLLSRFLLVLLMYLLCLHHFLNHHQSLTHHH